METLMRAITAHGLETVVIAVTINLLTGLLKLPIKCLVTRWNNRTSVTKYITFLPIIFGFGLMALYLFLMRKEIVFNNEFFTLWLTSTSLSLAFYAFFEKFYPSRVKILQENEIQENAKLMEALKERFLTDKNSNENNIEELQHSKESEQANPVQKIILRGNGKGEITTENESVSR